MNDFLRYSFILSLLASLTPNSAHAQGSEGGASQPPLIPVDLTSLDKNQTLGLFLLAGQSNMKGRGVIDMKPKTDPRIWFIHSAERKWFIAREPLHAFGTPDKLLSADNSGTGPGMSFATSIISKTKDDFIGLVPTAIGGVAIHTYGKEAKLYDRSLHMLRNGQELSPAKTKVRAVLWLQGESDATKQASVDAYESRLLDLVDRYREDLREPELPFIACTIGSFIAKGGKANRFPFTKEINEILLRLPEKRKNTACIDARDLDAHIGDDLHYNTEAQIEIGKRFAAAYLKLTEN